MKRLLILMLSISCYTSHAQENISIEQYMLRVIDYSLSIRESEQTFDYATSNSKLYKTYRKPSLSLNSEAYYSIDHPNMSAAVKNFNYLSYLTLSTYIYSGGKNKADSKIANLQQNIAREGMSIALLNANYSATLSYWALAAAAAQKETSNKYISLITNMLDIINTRYQDGAIAKGELLLMQTQLNLALYQKQQAEQYYQDAQISFNILMGEQNLKEFSLASSLESSEKIIEKNYDYTLHPSYLSGQYSIEESKENINLARSSYNPSVWVGVRGEAGTAAQNTDLKPKLWGTALASISVPIFGWNARKHSVTMAKANTIIAELTLKQTTDNLIDSYKTAELDLRQTSSQLSITKANLETATESLEIQNYSYKEGKLPVIYILQAQISWLEAYNNYISSTYNYKVAIAKYRFTTNSF